MRSKFTAVHHLHHPEPAKVSRAVEEPASQSEHLIGWNEQPFFFPSFTVNHLRFCAVALIPVHATAQIASQGGANRRACAEVDPGHCFPEVE